MAPYYLIIIVSFHATGAPVPFTTQAFCEAAAEKVLSDFRRGLKAEPITLTCVKSGSQCPVAGC